MTHSAVIHSFQWRWVQYKCVYHFLYLFPLYPQYSVGMASVAMEAIHLIMWDLIYSKLSVSDWKNTLPSASAYVLDQSGGGRGGAEESPRARSCRNPAVSEKASDGETGGTVMAAPLPPSAVGSSVVRSVVRNVEAGPFSEVLNWSCRPLLWCPLLP